MFTEAGLESAKTTTAALYDSSIEQLGKLTAQDMVKLFKGARVLDLILRADLTIQDLAMEAKCFGTTGLWLEYRMLRLFALKFGKLV